MAKILLGEGFSGIGDGTKEFLGTSDKAVKDGDGNVITETYATKKEIENIGGGSLKAIDIKIADTGNKFAADNVEDALAEVMAKSSEGGSFGEGSTVIVNATDLVQRGTDYKEGQIAYSSDLRKLFFLKCITAGTTTTGAISFEGKEPGDIINDGSVTWVVMRITNTDAGSTTPPIYEGGTHLYVDYKHGNSAMAPCTKGQIIYSNNTSTVLVRWADPEAKYGDVQWQGTVLVKKEGSYPENPADGIIVANILERNKHTATALQDWQPGAKNWYYRAFSVYDEGIWSSAEQSKFLAYDNSYRPYHYACYIDENDAVESTCVHDIEGYDNYGYEPIRMIFGTTEDNGVLDWGSWEGTPIMPRPCMLRYDGTVDYYLDVDDYTKKEDGTPSDVANVDYEGNAMMEFPCIFTKAERIGTKLYFYYSNVPHDSAYECYSCLKSDGTYAEHFYMPIYEGSVIDSKLRSISDQDVITSANLAMDKQMEYAHNNGEGWEINTWNDEELIRMLGILVLKRLNSQAAIGYGQTTSSYHYNSGVGNTKGMFYGHKTASAKGTKFFGMENIWGSRWRRIAGVINPANSGDILVKNTASTSDGSTVVGYNTTGDGYVNKGNILGISSGSSGSKSGYIKTINGKNGCVTIPSVVTGASNSTYYCDYIYTSYSSLVALCVGYHAHDYAGLFCSHLYYAPSSSPSHYGASSSYHAL